MRRHKLSGAAAIMMATALAVTSVAFNVPQMVFAVEAREVDENLKTPFGLDVNPNEAGKIGAVWGAAGYELYTVTIKCEANGYEKVYEDQNLSYHYYEDDYADGTYTVSVQGQQDGKLSPATSLDVVIGNAGGDEGEGGATGDAENPPVNPPVAETGDLSGINFDIMDHSADYIDGGTDVVVNYSGVKITATGSDWGNDWGYDSHWQLQLKEVVDTSENTVYDVSFKVKSLVDREIFVKLGDLHADSTVYGEQTIQLTAGQVTTIAMTTNKEVDIDDMMVLFALGTKLGSSDNTIVISNLKVSEHREAGVKEGAINLGNAKTELYVGSDWAGALATIMEDGTKATLNAENYGWNGEWGLQYMINALGLKAGESYKLSADITSSIDKKVLIKLDDSGAIVDTIELKAGELFEYEKEATVASVNNDTLYFALGQMSGEAPNRGGVLTIENVRLQDSLGNYIVLSGGTATGVKGLEYDFTADNSQYDFADPGKVKAGYDLIWADEFDGNYGNAKVDENTGLNLNNWAYQLGDGTTDCNNYGWGNNELQCYTSNAKNVAVNEDLDGDGNADGLLRITAAYEENGYTYAGESSKKYTSARLRTTDRNNALFNTTYGYVEARISLPQTQGAWPAFWMLPQSTDIYGGWPVSGEIDILETTGTQTNQACSTLHWGVPAHVYKGSGYTALNSDIRYFHTYAVDWKPGQMDFLYDGEVIYTSTNWESAFAGASDSLSFDAPFDMPFYMLLNLAVDSGQFGGAANKANFKDEINMYVDYVRVFQKTEGYPSAVDKSASGAAATDWADYAGKNLIADITNITTDAMASNEKEADATKWYLSTNANGVGGKAEVNVADGVTKVSISEAGSQDYAVQLLGHYNAKKGYVYKVSFDASATGGMVGKTVACDSKEFVGWSAYGIKSFTLAENTEHQEFIFEQTEDFDNCRIEFNIGGVGTGEVKISNVKVEIVDPAVIGATSTDGTHGVLANGNMIFNGTFDQGSRHLGYWVAGKGSQVIVPRYTTEDLTGADVKVKDVASMTNYEGLTDGIKYYERRAQISSNDGIAPVIYQPGIAMTADSYSLKFDLYSKTDSAVKASVYTVNVDSEGNVLGLDKEITSAKAAYKAVNGVKTYILNLETKEDIANAAIVLTFAKGTEVMLDNVSMTGANQKASFDETPIDEATTWAGDNGAGGGMAVDANRDGSFTMKGITSGGSWYSPQLASSDFETVAGLNYKLSFKYKLEGTNNGTFEYIVQENGGSWIVVSDKVKVESNGLTADAEGFYTYETTFNAGASVKNCHLNFGFGNSAADGAQFTIKDASMEVVKTGASGEGNSDNDSTVDDKLFDAEKPSQPTVNPSVNPGSSATSGSGSNEGGSVITVTPDTQTTATANTTRRPAAARTQEEVQDEAEEVAEEAVEETVETVAEATEAQDTTTVIEDEETALAAEQGASSGISTARIAGFGIAGIIVILLAGLGYFFVVKKER